MQPQACAACGGKLSPRYPAVRDPETGESFSIQGCAACGLGHTAPVPEEIGRYYCNEYYGGRHGFLLRWTNWRRLSLLSRARGGARPSNLLDVGCGDGALLLAARDRGYQVTGVELEPTHAREAGLTVFTSIPEAAARGPFDAITLWHSFEHFKAPGEALLEIGKLLAPGGVVLLAVPDAGSLQARLFGRFWLHLDVPRHLFHFDRASLEALVAKSGLAINRRWSQEFEYDVMGWVQSALNAVCATPNYLLRVLMGRSPRAPLGDVLLSWTLAPLLGLFAVPAVPISALFDSAGSRVVAARRVS